MSRLENNIEILKKIESVVNNCPELRFIQILWALGIIDGQDRFNEESVDTKKIVDNNYDKMYYYK